MILNVLIKNFIVLFEVTEAEIADKIEKKKTFLTVNDLMTVQSISIIFISFLMLF